MGNCLVACCEGPPTRHGGGQFRGGGGGGAGGYPTSPDQSRPPTFHHPQFRQLNDDRYDQQQRGNAISGEGTRISAGGAEMGTPGSGARRSVGQRTPGGQTPAGIAPMHDDRTTVYRQGTDQKSTILRTPRSAVSGRSTGRGGNTTPRAGAGGRSTPRAGGGNVANDPYADSEGGDEDEMILVCADCFADIMKIDDGKAPTRCSVTGKMHV